jgi:hypothetical protein
MFVPLLVVPLAAQLIAAVNTVPKLDVTPSCNGAARAGYVATTQERLQAASTANIAPATSSPRIGRASRSALRRFASVRSET